MEEIRVDENSRLRQNHSYHHDLASYIKYYRDGAIYYERWCKDNVLHRDDDMPAIKYYYPNGNIMCQKWHKDGKSHRDRDLPAHIVYNEYGKYAEEGWYLNGNKHRDGDLPAVIIYHLNDNIEEKSWFVNDSHFRINDQPQRVIYYDDYTVSSEIWFNRNNNMPHYRHYNLNGMLKYEKWFNSKFMMHRDYDLPAEIEYRDGKVKSETWYQNGRVFRIDGLPYIIKYNEQMEITSTVSTIINMNIRSQRIEIDIN